MREVTCDPATFHRLTSRTPSQIIRTRIALKKDEIFTLRDGWNRQHCFSVVNENTSLDTSCESSADVFATNDSRPIRFFFSIQRASKEWKICCFWSKLFPTTKQKIIICTRWKPTRCFGPQTAYTGRTFLKRFSGEPQLATMCSYHHWPGSMRTLRCTYTLSTDFLDTFGWCIIPLIYE
jgi:hypothetical protein